jgi:two-component system chemotaxis response regulator CheV
MTGVTDVDGKLIQILDVENILGSVSPMAISIAASELDISEIVHGTVLIVDDSALARKQTAETLQAINLPYIVATNGKEALEILKKCNLKSDDKSNVIAMVVSDIEMPEMDGYSLTENIRHETGLENMYVLLHTSLNGAINIEKAKQAGANDMLTKFIPEELMEKIVTGLQSIK